MDNFKKYPRTYHLPWSPGLTSDDKKLSDLSVLENADEVVVTLKMDGENTSMYFNGVHARSLESKQHESRNWVKKLQGQIGHLIPETMRICGENLFAKHSIEYSDLPSYFLAFSLWEKDLCLDWDFSQEFFQELGLDSVPVIYRGKFDQKAIETAFAPYVKTHEGYVVRVTSAFKYEDFKTHVGKFVRPNHVQTDEHWMNQSVIKNKLKT